MIGKPDLRLVSEGEPDKSFIFTVTNSSGNSSIFLARSEADAAWVAQRFDFIRTGAMGVRQDRDFVERQMGRKSAKLAELLKVGRIGRVEVSFVEIMRSNASFYPLVSTRTTIVGSKKAISL